LQILFQDDVNALKIIILQAYLEEFEKMNPKPELK